MALVTVAKLAIEAMLPNVDVQLVESLGYTIKTNSTRYKCFAESLSCVDCGLTGQYVKLEYEDAHKNPNMRTHMNLYALNESGEEILFTKDHIVPRSKGGANGISNMQTMCSPCNQSKANTLRSSDLYRLLLKAAKAKKGITFTAQQVQKLVREL